MSNFYKEAGVDLQAGYESVNRIKEHIKKTNVLGNIDSIGAFGAMFDLSILNYKEPILVSGTDGVGTKLMLAFEADKHDSVGIDLVAMCVNDILTQGARPLFFLDYIAVGKNVPEKIEMIVKGISDGCIQAGCALVGGETAEMPDMYIKDHYDLAGFCVGVVDKKDLIIKENVKPGDVLISLNSSGVHSNGFSLVRKIIKDNNLDLNKKYDGFDDTLINELLKPTRIYAKIVKQVLPKIKINSMAHITGGGFYENLPRILPNGCGIDLDMRNFKIPEIFKFLQKYCKMSDDEMANVFNMGVGYVFVVDGNMANSLIEFLKELGEDSQIIGKVVQKDGLEIIW